MKDEVDKLKELDLWLIWDQKDTRENDRNHEWKEGWKSAIDWVRTIIREGVPPAPRRE